MSEVENSNETPREIPIPQASFSLLVFQFRADAEMSLGLMHYGEEPPEPRLPLARHAIDMLAVLQEKTKGNLSMEEQRYLENTLTELRFRYVQVSEEMAKARAQNEGAKQEERQGESEQAQAPHA